MSSVLNKLILYGTLMLAGGFLLGSVYFLCVFLQSNRRSNLLLAGSCFMAFGFFFVSNPWGNMMLFQAWDQRNAQRLEREMLAAGIEGMTPEEVLHHFGVPHGPEVHETASTWHYRASPWFVFAWNQYVQISFRENQVEYIFSDWELY